MSDKLNCYECKNWFEVDELVYLPVEGYYLCYHDAATFYAMRCVQLRARAENAEEKNIELVKTMIEASNLMVQVKSFPFSSLEDCASYRSRVVDLLITINKRFEAALKAGAK